jgi:proline iminopeptidase
VSASIAAGAEAHGVVHTPDGDIGYETLGARGQALPVIAVNGGPGLSHVYMVQNDLWTRVSRHRLVVLYDQRGTGWSKAMRPGAPQTLEADVADLDAVRAALKLDKVALVGDSFGGFLCMAYAAAHPEHVAKLVLSDSPPPAMKDMVHLLPQSFPDVEEADTKEQKALGANTVAAARASLRNHFKMIFYSPEKRDAYLSHMGNLGFEPAVGAAMSKSISSVDMTDKVKTFTAFPTLVMSGRYDMNVAPLTAWNLAHLIPGARLVYFEKSSHLPSFEEPARYQTVLEGFLDGK